MTDLRPKALAVAKWLFTGWFNPVLLTLSILVASYIGAAGVSPWWLLIPVVMGSIVRERERDKAFERGRQRAMIEIYVAARSSKTGQFSVVFKDIPSTEEPPHV